MDWLWFWFRSGAQDPALNTWGSSVMTGVLQPLPKYPRQIYEYIDLESEVWSRVTVI